MDSPLFTYADIEYRLSNLPAATSVNESMQLGLVQALLARHSGKSKQAQQFILAKASLVLDRYESQLKSITRQPNAIQPATATSGLSDLVELLNQHALHLDTASATTSLDELMESIERDIFRPTPAVQTFSTQPLPAKKSRSRKKTPTVTPSGQELKAVRQARKNMALDKASHLVDEMKNRQPENPGPLNPQMLATRAITQMRDLSPAYLNRFLTLMDTLFWLPKN